MFECAQGRGRRELAPATASCSGAEAEGRSEALFSVRAKAQAMHSLVQHSRRGVVCRMGERWHALLQMAPSFALNPLEEREGRGRGSLQFRYVCERSLLGCAPPPPPHMLAFTDVFPPT